MRICVLFLLIIGMCFPGALPGRPRAKQSDSAERIRVVRLAALFIPRPAPQYFAVPWMYYPQYIPQPIPVPMPAPIPFPEIFPAPVPLPEVLPAQVTSTTAAPTTRSNGRGDI